MAAPSPAALLEGESVVLYVFTLVAQTFFFGTYTVLILLSTRLLLKRGLRTKSVKALFIACLFMYTLSAMYWAYSIADVGARAMFYIDPRNSHYYDQLSKIYDLFNALVLVNFVLSDTVVIWRAWAICGRYNRGFLAVPVVFYFFTAVSAVTLIVLQSAEVINRSLKKYPFFTPTVNILQICFVGSSVLSNLSATGNIAVTAWWHRRRIQAAFTEKSKVDQVLMLLIESGALYSISATSMAACMLIRLPNGTIGDLVLPTNVQIAGAYAPLVFLLVSHHTSASETEFLGSVGMRVSTGAPVFSTLRFAVNSSASPPRRGAMRDLESCDGHVPGDLNSGDDDDGVVDPGPREEKKTGRECTKSGELVLVR